VDLGYKVGRVEQLEGRSSLAARNARDGTKEKCVRRALAHIMTQRSVVDGRRLLKACVAHDSVLVAELITGGADVETALPLPEPNRHNFRASDYYFTSLHFACEDKDEDMVSLLLDNNADITKLGGLGYTPLQLACRYGHASVATQLHSWGAGVHRTDVLGVTPVMAACSASFESSIVEVLLANSSDENQIAPAGITPLQSACCVNNRAELTSYHFSNLVLIPRKQITKVKHPSMVLRDAPKATWTSLSCC
jgi:hypothetical protein